RERDRESARFATSHRSSSAVSFSGMYGLVVTDRSESVSHISHAVFVDRRMPLLFIKRPTNINRRMLSKEERKAIDKAEREKALSFGDWISFNEYEIEDRIIGAYKKEYPLCESRAIAEHLQIEAVCVFSPPKEGGTSKCFADLLGLISTPNEVAELFLPDVALRCWISVEVTHMEVVQFSFGAFIDIAEDQSPVLSMPWNRSSLRRFVVEADDDSDDDSAKSSRCDNTDLPSVLIGMVGLRTGGRTVLCFDFKHIPFLLAYQSPYGRASLGDIIIFEAHYSGFRRAYVIGTFRKKDDAPSFGSKLINFGTLPVLEISVALSDLPFGYLRAVNEDLGVVSDRFGLLTPALLNSPKGSVFDVYAADTGAGAFARFRIRDISERAAEMLKKCSSLGYKPLEDLEGIVLDNGLVMVRDYGMLKIRFGENSTDGWETLQPGTWIKFTASSESGPADFVVQKWTKSFERTVESLKHVLLFEEHMFQTTCHYRKDLKVLESTAFGFVDDPHQICSSKKAGEPITLWVKRGDTESRTPFIVCSIEDPEVGMKRTADERYQPVKRSTQLTDDGKSEMQSDKVSAEECPSAENGKSCTNEDCCARELLHELLTSNNMRQIIEEVGGNDILLDAIAATSHIQLNDTNE
uniref:Uncharacterized protein n=1 Tax=Parascaris univalens TaxID=6257 RepID=A0A915AXL8_PARUN